jgi:hypothetical protein
MNCKTIQEQLPELALEHAPATPEMQAHLRQCGDCARSLESLKATMSLLDEWQAPELSPYWDVRMQARLREEQARAVAPHGWLQWLRRPALSLSAALCLVLGIGLYQINRFYQAGEMEKPMVHFSAPTGTAVADLQYLGDHSDMFQNFDALDVLDGDDDADSNN